MKKIMIFLFFTLLIVVQSHALVPSVLTYSGKVTDKNSNLLPDGIYDMRFSLYTVVTGGTASWTEFHYIADGNGVTITAGGFNVLIGSVAKPAPFPSDFTKNYYLQTEININSNWEVFGRRAIESVAYAHQADVANGVMDNCIITTKIADGAVTAAKISSLPSIYGGEILGQTITGANLVNSTITQTQASFAPMVAVNGTWRNGPKIAGGQASSDGTGKCTISLTAYGFTNPPIISCTSAHGDTPKLVTISSVTTSSAVIDTWTDQSGGGLPYALAGPITFQWIAIGY
jgi:hypothetical protein